MEARLIVLGTILALVLASVGGPLLASTPAAASTSVSCEQTVTHDLRDQGAIDAVNETGAASSSASNTQVRLEETTGFVRIHADNPNGYCVAYTVEIAPAIVSPADLGTIASNDDETEASWRAAQNLSSGEVYTRIEFTLPAGDNATFAPSKVRVRSLSWTGTAKQEGAGVLDRVRGIWSDPKLEKREYEITPTGDSSRITVPLESSDGEQIEEWQATYTIGETKRPIDQDAAAPVYYTESASSVTFHFSDDVRNDASVTFVAEPNLAERTRHSASAYWSGLEVGGSWLPWSVVTPEVSP